MTQRILGVGAIIFDDADRLLLVLRGREPQAGRWSIPGGKVEPGESLSEAVIREVLEETGLTVTVGVEAWVVDIPAGAGSGASGPNRVGPSSSGEVIYEVHDFVAEVVAGTLCAGDDAADACWAGPEELAALPLTDGLVEHLRRHGLLR
ncbi:NUDIX domain-containing protein [Gordonia sp. CPCC 205515]|uniref:NUDIX hydrolase n=1 Tax=Gordonia sp. CPCC 205515 TaxID=3140791 RepID=UPI003AF3BD63